MALEKEMKDVLSLAERERKLAIVLLVTKEKISFKMGSGVLGVEV